MDYFLSATSHFVFSIILLGTGIAAITKVRIHRYILFASIPFVFSLQQLSEATLLLTAGKTGYENIGRLLGCTYLLLTEAVLPILMPLSILLLERNLVNKIVLRILLGIGLFVSLYLTLCLLTFDIGIDEIGGRLYFIQPWTPERVITSIPFLLVTLFPFFVSGYSRVRWMGTLFFCGCALIYSVFDTPLLSLYSMCGGLISIFVLFVINGLKHRKDKMTMKKLYTLHHEK